ncbi:hypothetical protein N7490_002886 [Penicillium lividum]|nr:hypothetical protein N7490_002886 [Penicillium lividum]
MGAALAPRDRGGQCYRVRAPADVLRHHGEDSGPKNHSSATTLTAQNESTQSALWFLAEASAAASEDANTESGDPTACRKHRARPVFLLEPSADSGAGKAPRHRLTYCIVRSETRAEGYTQNGMSE